MSILASASAFLTASKSCGIGDHFKALLADLHILRSRIERQRKQGIFIDLPFLNREESFLMELPRHRAGFRHVSMIFCEDTSDLRNGPIPVVAGDFDQEGRTARPISFEGKLFITHAGQFTRPPLNRLFQGIARHVRFFRLGDRQP